MSGADTTTEWDGGCVGDPIADVQRRFDTERAPAPPSSKPPPRPVKMTKLPTSFLVFAHGVFHTGTRLLTFTAVDSRACAAGEERRTVAIRGANNALPNVGWCLIEARANGLYAVEVKWLVEPTDPVFERPVYPVAKVSCRDGAIARIDELFFTEDPVVGVSWPLDLTEQCEVMRESCDAQLAACGWKAAIEAAHAQRNLSGLPKGWTRVFESHWDCAPAYLYYAPGDHPDQFTRADGSHVEPSYVAHARGLEKRAGGIWHEDEAQIAQVAAEDSAWLRAWELACPDHVCGEPLPHGPPHVRAPLGDIVTVADWWLEATQPCLAIDELPYDASSEDRVEFEACFGAVSQDAVGHRRRHPESWVTLPVLAAAEPEVDQFLEAVAALHADRGLTSANSTVAYIARRDGGVFRVEVSEVPK